MNSQMATTPSLAEWFKGGQEFVWWQWQRKSALARAFMRETADILVLMKPTAAMALKLRLIFSAIFPEHTKTKMAILNLTVFQTVRLRS